MRGIVDVGGLSRQGAGAAPEEDGREETVLQVLYRLIGAPAACVAAGVVCKVQAVKLGRPVALKFLPNDLDFSRKPALWHPPSKTGTQLIVMDRDSWFRTQTLTNSYP